MIIKGKNGNEINSIEDWFKYAPPARGTGQWKDYRSAKELAKSWFRHGGAQIPEELSELLNNNTATKKLKIKYVLPEKETRLDNYGKGRTHDLILIGENENENILIAIEAKVDEPFGELISKYLKKTNSKSNIPLRIEQLNKSLFRVKPSSDLRYQLLHSIAGTLIEAKAHNASMAIFVVHEFCSSSSNPIKRKRNQDDLNEFVSSLLTKTTLVESNDLIGPIKIPGSTLIPWEISLYIGKIITLLDY